MQAARRCIGFRGAWPRAVPRQPASDRGR